MKEISVTKLNHINQYLLQSKSIYYTCILENKAQGTVWGDKEDNPDFLLVWSPY